MTDREKIIDILQEVLFVHHDDFSKADKDACELAAAKIIIMFNLSIRDNEGKKRTDAKCSEY